MSFSRIAKTMPAMYNKYKQHVGGVPMKYIEDVHWILDKPGTTIHNQDEQFRENIAFVRSLGKKCDCVGWSKLSREDPQAEEILEKIADFCK